MTVGDEARARIRSRLPLSVEREIEDIEALINEASGEAFLYGISSGAALALEATVKLGHKVKKLALYEAPYDSDAARQQAVLST